ncbi:MarR family winged helix-turn-helix transcriptional regulator [Actinopolymorpha singaporensis]|uniref:MarR family winged helix-turn-helix transcriptional regulator n=1 Tax=Actinopolymorpha singaporensis TaxID=117157 RepID=UPI000B87C835|nr:MarR family transcriptional regulator [Actinopolymorpha singaporensis]
MKDDEPSVERAVRAIVRLARLLERADAGLSLAQFRILELVSRGTERSTHIATRLATSKPAITVVVEGLVAAGLLTRRGEPGDRRVVRLALTTEGREALAQAEIAYGDRLRPLLAEISAPDALLGQLAEVDDAMDARWARHSPSAKDQAPKATAAKEAAAAKEPTDLQTPPSPEAEVPATR